MSSSFGLRFGLMTKLPKSGRRKSCLRPFFFSLGILTVFSRRLEILSRTEKNDTIKSHTGRHFRPAGRQDGTFGRSYHSKIRIKNYAGKTDGSFAPLGTQNAFVYIRSVLFLFSSRSVVWLMWSRRPPATESDAIDTVGGAQIAEATGVTTYRRPRTRAYAIYR